jgi:hypothetical protein
MGPIAAEVADDDVRTIGLKCYQKLSLLSNFRSQGETLTDAVIIVVNIRVGYCYVGGAVYVPSI